MILFIGLAKRKTFVYEKCSTLEACDSVNIKISVSQVESSGRVLDRLSGLVIPLPWQGYFQNTADKCFRTHKTHL